MTYDLLMNFQECYFHHNYTVSKYQLQVKPVIILVKPTIPSLLLFTTDYQSESLRPPIA